MVAIRPSQQRGDAPLVFYYGRCRVSPSCSRDSTGRIYPRRTANKSDQERRWGLSPAALVTLSPAINLAVILFSICSNWADAEPFPGTMKPVGDYLDFCK